MLTACGALIPPPASRRESPWREMIYNRFRGLPAPLLCFPDGIIPAASIWTGTRVWLEELRLCGLEPGDRIACALSPGPAFVMLLLAALWEGYTLALLPPGELEEATLKELDVRLLIGNAPSASIRVDRDSLPASDLRAWPLRDTRSPRSPSVQLLARSSGTSGPGKWAAISSSGLLSVLQSHAPFLDLENARVLSLLPWHHLFGLVIELLPALFAGAEIIRSLHGGRDTSELLALGWEHDITHLNGVPLTFLRLMDIPQGRDFLKGLHGGVVGGAPISAHLAEFLSGTRLRVGYGQTEASPGIALGDVGSFFPGCLGRPLGCEVRIDSDGVLQFRGENACLGYWSDGALGADAADWRSSGDLAEWTPNGLRFVGRADERFKLANGRMISPSLIEERLKCLTHQDHIFWVFSRDSRNLSLFHTAQAGRSLSESFIEEAFGGTSGLCKEVVHQPLAFFKLTSKGELNRRAMFKQLPE